MLLYPAALPLSSRTLNYTAGVIRRYRREIGSCWRKLNPGRQALLVLAYLRKGETFADLAAGFGVSTATAWRYVTETVTLLAARSPKLRRALADATHAGHAYVGIDGTLIPIDRVAANRPYYSGKQRHHGMNLQVISPPDGEILWVSGPLPGAVHDLTAARIWGVLRELAAHARFDGRGLETGRNMRNRQSPTLLDVIFMGSGFLAAGSGLSGPGIGGDGARRASAAGSAVLRWRGRRQRAVPGSPVRRGGPARRPDAQLTGSPVAADHA